MSGKNTIRTPCFLSLYSVVIPAWQANSLLCYLKQTRRAGGPFLSEQNYCKIQVDKSHFIRDNSICNCKLKTTMVMTEESTLADSFREPAVAASRLMKPDEVPS